MLACFVDWEDGMGYRWSVWFELFSLFNTWEGSGWLSRTLGLDSFFPSPLALASPMFWIAIAMTSSVQGGELHKIPLADGDRSLCKPGCVCTE